jgi:hypothetical protein
MLLRPTETPVTTSAVMETSMRPQRRRLTPSTALNGKNAMSTPAKHGKSAFAVNRFTAGKSWETRDPMPATHATMREKLRAA